MPLSLTSGAGVRRREFIILLGGVAPARPLGARAQPPARVRRIGVLMGYAENDPEAQTRLGALKQTLLTRGWSEAHNIRIDLRWSPSGDMERVSSIARELVGLKPEVILSNTTPVTAALRQETSTVPIVFVPVSDPVGEGFVNSLPRPGRNMTGFINFEPAIIGKWVDLLKDIAPSLTKLAFIFNPE